MKATLATLAAEYNARAAASGKKPIKKFTCSLAIAQRRVAALPPVAKATSIAGRCRQLIRDGATNDEIFKRLKLPDAKRHYPQWYRAQLRRDGVK